MNATRGIEFRAQGYAAALGSLLLATALFITGCGSGSSGSSESGSGNANSGNSNSGSTDGGSTDGNSGNSSPIQVDYMETEQGYVEVFKLNVDSAGNVTGAVYDVYNCGNGESGTAPAPIAVTGTAPTESTLDLQFEGEAGDDQGQVVNQGLDLTNASGSTLELLLITASNSLSNALSQQLPVDSISGYTCEDLPATSEP